MAALGITIICGMPLVFLIVERGRWISKILLSFVMGYVLLSLAGISANLIGISPFIAEAAVVLIGAVLSLRYRDRLRGELDRDDWIVLGIGSLYIFLLIAFFDHIVMWMAGDAVAHAAVIRMLQDGETVPISIPPFGSHWEYYPKAFHLYSYFWTKIFPLLNVIQTIPVIITAITPALLYSSVREIGKSDDAVYAFILACFVFPAHYSHLIWAGYPTAAAEMLLVASILAVLVDWRLLPLMLLGILFSHPRLLILACGILFAWAVATRLRSYLPHILTGCAALNLIVFLALPAHRPEFLISIITSQSLACEQAARWYPAFLSLFGMVIALERRNREDRLATSWFLAMIFMVLLADVGLMSFAATADRLLLELYLPLSLLGALSLSRMDGSIHRIKVGFIVALLLSGMVGMGAVFYSYAGSWGLPPEDYEAIMWLSEQNLSDPFCINLDETGAWIYPLTGIKVANPRMVPVNYSYRRVTWCIARDPNDEKVLENIRHFEHDNIIICVSCTSNTQPGYIPPFTEYADEYPLVNLNFSQENYELVYSQGAKIFRDIKI